MPGNLIVLQISLNQRTVVRDLSRSLIPKVLYFFLLLLVYQVSAGLRAKLYDWEVGRLTFIKSHEDDNIHISERPTLLFIRSREDVNIHISERPTLFIRSHGETIPPN